MSRPSTRNGRTIPLYYVPDAIQIKGLVFRQLCDQFVHFVLPALLRRHHRHYSVFLPSDLNQARDEKAAIGGGGGFWDTPQREGKGNYFVSRIHFHLKCLSCSPSLLLLFFQRLNKKEIPAPLGRRSEERVRSFVFAGERMRKDKIFRSTNLHANQ